MDKNDYKILQKLDENARISVVKLAREVRLSKDVVNYRLRKLQEEKVLVGSRANIAIAKLGYTYHKILVKFVPLNTVQEEQWLAWGRLHHEVIWMGTCDGEWNGNMTVRTKSFQELALFLDDFFGTFGGLVLKKEILRVMSSYRFNRKFLFLDGKYTHEFYHSFFAERVEIDAKDSVIIHLLTKDARTKLVDIAQSVDLSPEAVAVRLAQLEKNKVIIGYRQKIDYTKFGLQNYEVLLVVKNPQQKAKIISYCRYHRACDTVMEFMGYYDLQLTFLLKSQAEFRLLLADMRDAFGEHIIEYQPLAAYQEFFTSPVGK